MPAQFPILLVDDDPYVADILNRAAKSTFSEAQFVAIHSFEEAVRYLEGLNGPGPRLVLLDINLQSTLTGLDFLSLWRQHPQGRLVPIIILSADQNPAQSREAYFKGANAFTIKPFSFEGWKDYVQQLSTYWFEVATLPRLWFDNETSEPNQAKR